KASSPHGERQVRDAGFPGPPSRRVKAIYQDLQGNMWFGSWDGLLRLSPGAVRDAPASEGRWTTFTTEDGLATDYVQVIIAARDGGLWVGGIGGLSHIRNGQIRAWKEEDGLPSNHVRALYEDAEGVLWIGTYDGGIGRFANGRFTKYTVRNGLFDKGAFQILEDGRGNLWVSSNRGIYRLRKRQLNEFAAGKLNAIASFGYARNEGTRNEECNGGFWPAGFKAQDGRLWFPTQDGAAIVDLQALSNAPQPPSVVIESLEVDRSPRSIHQPIRIDPGQENVEIQYTGLQLQHSEHIRFKYQLRGFDRDWVEVGARRTAYYQHVPPGIYTFRVTAAMADGEWNVRPAEVLVDVLPAFHQTAWFRSLVLLIAASSLWLLWRYRIGQLERERASRQAFSRQLITSQENERKRIAAELHDSLGQRLVVIKNRALLLLRTREGSPELGEAHREQVEEISSEVSEAVREVKEIAYDLRPYRLDRLGLTTAL